MGDIPVRTGRKYRNPFLVSGSNTKKSVCVCGSGTRERERERERAREHLKGFIMIQSSYIGAFDNTKLDFDVYHVLGSMEGDHGLAIHDLGFRV